MLVKRIFAGGESDLGKKISFTESLAQRRTMPGYILR